MKKFLYIGAQPCHFTLIEKGGNKACSLYAGNHYTLPASNQRVKHLVESGLLIETLTTTKKS